MKTTLFAAAFALAASIGFSACTGTTRRTVDVLVIGVRSIPPVRRCSNR